MMRKFKNFCGRVWEIFLGAVFVQSPIFAIVVIGWVYRYMQWTALKCWWNIRGANSLSGSFADFAREHEPFRDHERRPNWIFTQRPIQTFKKRITADESVFRKMHGLIRVIYASGKKNFVIGVQGYFNIFVLTLLPSILWQFGWYSGWDNSFNKGYEQHDYGILISLIGIAIFIALMFYLPMAQARQAITGEWRSFYQFNTVWQLVKSRPMACLFLAGLYSLISIPLTLFKSIPLFIGNINPATETMSNLQLLEYMQGYFFRTGILFFVGYVILHRVAAKIYAKALIDALATNAITIKNLSSWEVEVLARLSLLNIDPSKQTHIAVKVAKSIARPAWKVGLTTATVIIWFSFVAQVFTSEFLVYHPLHGMLNQPLVQLPWYNYTPSHLKEPQEPSNY